MNKLGLKLWSNNIDCYYNDVQKLFNKGYFDFIELYVIPGTLNLLEKWEKLNIPINIHAPHFFHGMNLSSSNAFIKNLKLYQEAKKYADEVAASYIVFHSGIDGDYKETARQLKEISDNRSIIENKPYKTLPSIEGTHCVGSKIEEIKYIVDFVNCGFCLDIGHAVCTANSFKIDPYLYIQDFAKLTPNVVHLSDICISNEIDEHLNYGKGDLDFIRVLEMLPEGVPIVIETDKQCSYSLSCFEKDVVFLKHFLD